LIHLRIIGNVYYEEIKPFFFYFDACKHVVGDSTTTLGNIKIA